MEVDNKPELVLAGTDNAHSATTKISDVPVPDTDSSTGQDSKLDQCLICCNVALNMDSDLNLKNSGRYALDQLNDLLKVFRISLTSFKEIELEGEAVIPSKLFCETCSKNICEALDLLSRIECLQREFKILVKILRKTLLNNWASEAVNKSVFNNHIRKILVQCFSDCKVLLEGPKLKVKRGRGKQLSLKIHPATAKRRLPDISKRGRPRKTTAFSRIIASLQGSTKEVSEPNEDQPVFDNDVDDDYMPCESDDGGEQENCENDISCKSSLSTKRSKSSVVQKMRKKCKLSSVLNGRVEKKKTGKLSNRVYGDKGRTLSYECLFCQKKLYRDDYEVDSGEYVFKCSTDCCDKTASTFGHLIAHHEATCPMSPRGQKLNKKLSKVGSLKNLKYNDRHMVVGFECPVCQKQMTPSDYKVESGGYLFKCTWESCDTITRTFFNMAYHHHSHCAGKPNKKPRWKSNHKLKPGQAIENESPTGEHVITVSKSGNGREYDKNGRIISFECPHCKQKMTHGDFFVKAINKFAYKCFPLCCGKDFSTFANLISHHESRCRSVADGVQTTDDQQQAGILMTKKPRKQIRTYDTLSKFQCKHCRKDYTKEECINEASGGTFFDCDIPGCDKSFNMFCLFRRHHEATCSEKLPGANICEHCGKKCQTAQVLRNHLASFHTGDYRYFCEKCGIGLVSNNALRRHMLTHLSERKFQCSYCLSTFKRKDHLINHERRHKAELTHMCGVCGKRFAVREGLRQHELNFHGQGEFICTICKKTFKSTSYLRHHIWATHKGMRKKGGRRHSVEECEFEVIEAIEILPAEDRSSRQKDASEGPTIHEEDIMAVNSLLSMTTVDIID